ncbi:DEAD/DEAH box helicase family protein [Chryseobacterium oryctis]|uniref:DEAD/DEAH box helicase family protein n=1 Tax=Chryseobacterium oryctis TaxID=2952618 RepID=A0ABT3HQN0_9FLAO|nr:DEAD/DEAH box helicase family protein [Chryseobacterium oryctis]MCW3161953.1 DEAD/DEAH box helicase family protein [Chryseobacterium oryctis]
MMKSFPKDIVFKYPWRKYQKRLLDELDSYVSDGHVHVVAPPGSGKTVLGLEVMLRLNQPTLIVAPTIAIKEQWIHRFTELFLQTETTPNWVSYDIRNLGFVTVVTYQGIHSAMTGFSEDEDSLDFSRAQSFIKNIKDKKIKTLVLDEAHHLKKSWFKSLIELKQQLEPNTIALTATPPMDVSPHEWRNYIELNGPVDIEISVPELMIEKDLCPHQDLVYFSLPTATEHQKIENIYKKAQSFWDELNKDAFLLKVISSHPVYQNPEQHLEWIYSNISFYTSGLVFMNHNLLEIPKIHFKIIGDEQEYVPEFNFFWLEELLEFYLFSHDSYFKQYDDKRLELENRLKRNGFLENRFIQFIDNKNIHQILNTSIGKLEGGYRIASQEFENFGTDLRMVVLTDFIRKEFLINEEENNLELNKIGAIPVFEILRRNASAQKKIGVLTGSIVIVPKSVVEQNVFQEGITFTYSPLSFDADFVQLSINDQNRSQMVRIVTELFQKGEILILIGTKSLLGEGWDAPKINSLVLASFVSSFVLSNQMRGRAIRTDRDDPFKTSNIWHLVCFDDQAQDGGADYQRMQKRFKTFVGISNYESSTIENNFERLAISTMESSASFEENNQRMFKFSKNKKLLLDKWNEALSKGNYLVEEIRIESEENFNEKKLKSIGSSIRNFSGAIISSVLMFGADFFSGLLKHFQSVHSFQYLSQAILGFGFIGILAYGGRFYRSWVQYLRYKNASKNLFKISEVVLASLIKEKIIRTPLEQLEIVVMQDGKGDKTCYLAGGTNYEKSQFILTLEELFAPIDNPRYLLATKGSFLFKLKKHYYAMPEIFGKNKKSAEYFTKVWKDKLGNIDLIFTRTIEGRKLLLKLRFQAIIRKNKYTEHIRKWVR